MFGRKKKNKETTPEIPSMVERPRVVRTVPELATFSYTDQGRREYQQDAVYVTPSKKFAANRKTRVMAVVCDGMGGMADGGKASRTAIQMMINGFQNAQSQPQMNIPGFFRSAIVTIDKTIASFPKENGRGSGTTMVAAIAEENKLYWASVGDSRIYVIRENKQTGQQEIRQITRDHNYWLRLQEMVAQGKMTQEEAMGKRQKEALISFLGIGNVSLMDISTQPIEMQYGDIVMLCSDGITKTLPDHQIKNIILDDKNPIEKKAVQLVEAAIHGNTHSQDNTSVAILQYRESTIKKER